MKQRLPAPIPIDLSVLAVPAPPVELPYQGDATYYDSGGATGSIAGGTVLMGPIQTSPTGSITGGTVLPPETIYD